MKFSTEHYTNLKNAVIEAVNDLHTEISDLREEGQSETRFVWDLFWACKWSKSADYRQSNYLDSHIQTALKNIVKELEAQK